ncbi:MAG: class I SAM-dependent methyltransferase [Acidimicrobiales bacterium]
MPALTSSQARRVYDRIGRAQDWQAFYEDRAVDRLLAHSELGSASSVFELGCGTGRLAARLMGLLGPDASYRGVDLSPVMVSLARARLAGWPDRARVALVDGSLPLPCATGSVERFVSSFVLDLLASDHARAVLAEARRILAPDGLACLASLAPGVSRAERAVSRAWMAAWERAPSLVGGCRPISLLRLVGAEWQVRHHSLVRAYGLVTEVVVASVP